MPSTPMPVRVNGVAGVIVEWRYNEQIFLNRFGYYLDPFPVGKLLLSSLQSLADAFVSDHLADIRTVLSDQIQALSVTVMSMDDNTTLPWKASPINAMGLRTGDPLPPFVTAVLKRQTSLRGRQGKGNVRLGGLSETDQLNGLLVAAAQTLFGNLCGSLGQPIPTTVQGSANWRPALIKAATQFNVNGDSVNTRAQAIEDWDFNIELSSQLTRKYGRGI